MGKRPTRGLATSPKSWCVGLAGALCAYDAYVLEAALVRRAPLLTLDKRLAEAAEQAGVATLEVCT